MGKILDQTNRKSKPELTTLLGCILVALLVCYAHIRGSTMLIIASLLLYVVFHLWTCSNDLGFSALLFFLPWSPLLKVYRGGISIFTIALLLTCLIALWKRGFAFELYQVILTAVLMGLTLIAKAIQGNTIANNYLLFLAMLLLFPCVVKEHGINSNFWYLTLFFSLGIITAALSAQRVAGYGGIAQYIKVDSYQTITRLSGYYGDPNFYSAHITACLAGVQILLSCERERRRQLLLSAIAVALIYCGLLSASKSFILVAVCLFIVWIPILLERGNRSGKARVVVGIVCVGIIMLSSSAFQSLLRIVDDRFSYSANISQLTTGRTDLWKKYIEEFLHNAPLTLLGEGYTSVTLDGFASHNTVIQGIFQFGIIGFPIFLTWVYLSLKSTFVKYVNIKANWKFALLMCVGVVLPWMALDLLFFDEFFLLPAYAMVGILYVFRKKQGIHD